MNIALYTGLALALLASPLLLLAFKALHLDTRALWVRLSLWGFAIVTLALAASSGGPWLAQIGVHALGWAQGLETLAAIVVVLAGMPLLQRLQKRLGGKATDQMKAFRKAAGQSLLQRLFLVVTAAVVEEVLYRGYAIGIGTVVFGNLWIAFVVSLAAFVAAHLRWDASQLVTAFWAGLVLALLFVVSGNLFACIIAHFVVDAVGFLLMPRLISSRTTPQSSS